MNNEVSHTLAGRLDSPQPRQTPRLALSYGVKITSNCISLTPFAPTTTVRGHSQLSKKKFGFLEKIRLLKGNIYYFTGVTVESADRIGILVSLVYARRCEMSAPKRPRALAATVVHSQRENPPCCHSFIVVALYSRLQALAFWSRKLLPTILAFMRLVGHNNDGVSYSTGYLGLHEPFCSPEGKEDRLEKEKPRRSGRNAGGNFTTYGSI
ncbi:hypothetical protein HZH68_000915 [Vespula germanica]|uniref:Uncharacterized protein n=1 Tax=Vespula germanica TaxID=30212 RepID=A0A834U6H2_VESGE|nr:hypothetical protein HZH68_000915 [Vespula germanica]